MNKTQKVFLILALVIALMLSVTAIVMCFISLKGEMKPSEIYTQSLKYVVEVKAVGDVGESYGTGEIMSADGKIVTNAHVVTYTRLSTVNEFDEYYIRFAFEDDYREVTLETYDADLDVAVLRLVDCSNLALKPIATGNSEGLKSGETVYAIGNASNYGIGIFEGIISVPLVKIELESKTRSVIQCDLTIAAGNSGGALLNEKGELVGITTFRTKDTSGNVVYGIMCCIPINVVLEYINR